MQAFRLDGRKSSFRRGTQSKTKGDLRGQGPSEHAHEEVKLTASLLKTKINEWL